MLVTKMAKTVTNISKLSPIHSVSNIRHQHRCSYENSIATQVWKSSFVRVKNTEVSSELRHRYVSFFKNHVKKWSQYCNDVMLLLKRWINKWRFWLCWYGFFKDSACHARIPTTNKQTKSATTNVSANHWFSTTEKNRWSLVKSRFQSFHCKYCE